ncbi:MAG TPA: DUF2141 domain-containing protein [Kiloniellaceae bacterium]|nr:DUF2141 domain-containing protein [Kiloniellaceae bacterium]
MSQTEGYLQGEDRCPGALRRPDRATALRPRPAVLAMLCALGLWLTAAPAVAGDAAAATDAVTTLESDPIAGESDSGGAAGGLAEGPLLACEDHPYQVVVTVEDMRNLDGLLTVELYDDNPDGFIKKAGRLERYRLEATRSESEICIVAPGPGTYAVVLYHDENGNKKFDKNFLGIPKEGFGVSNNPGFSLGPPAHADSAFTLGEDPVVLTISMTYL